MNEIKLWQYLVIGGPCLIAGVLLGVALVREEYLALKRMKDEDPWR